MHHAFLYISLPFFPRLRRENAYFRVFYGERKQVTTNFISLSELEYGPLSKIQIQEGSPTFEKVSKQE